MDASCEFLHFLLSLKFANLRVNDPETAAEKKPKDQSE
jgi:hypothetical protein